MFSTQNDIEQPADPEQYERLNTVVRKLRRSRKNALPNACCCCLDTRLGCQLACLIWAGFSLYFSVLGFMRKSPFYSYLNPVALYIYAVLNLIFFFINMAGFFIITWRAAPLIIGRLANIIWGFVLFILIDTSANYLVFIIQSSQYRSWCIDTSQNRVQQAYNQVNTINDTISIPLNPLNDYYNCSRLYQDEITWGLLSTITIILIYIHWAMVFTSWEKWFVIQAPRMVQHNDIKTSMDSMDMLSNQQQTMDIDPSSNQQQHEDISHLTSNPLDENEKSHYDSLNDPANNSNISRNNKDNHLNNNNINNNSNINNNNMAMMDVNPNEMYPSEQGYYPQDQYQQPYPYDQGYYPQDHQQQQPYSYDPNYYYHQEQQQQPQQQQNQYPMNNNYIDPNLYQRY